jgi:type II secretory pathway pseudopilin PulG
MIKQVNKNSCTGFTIIEVLVSSILLTFLMITAVLFLRRGRDIEARDFQRRTARHIIENQFEIKYNHKRFDEFESGDHYNQNITVNNKQYILTTDIERIDVQAIDNIVLDGYKITANVSWQTPTGPDELELTKWIADTDIQ